MFINTFAENMRNQEVVLKVIEVSGILPLMALVPLKAVSEPQQELAGHIRNLGIKAFWEDLADEYQTREMARALIAAVNRHEDARYWLDNKNAYWLSLLSDEVEKELGE